MKGKASLRGGAFYTPPKVVGGWQVTESRMFRPREQQVKARLKCLEIAMPV